MAKIWLKMVVKRLLVSLLTFVTPYMYSQVLLQNKDRDTLINFWKILKEKKSKNDGNALII